MLPHQLSGLSTALYPPRANHVLLLSRTVEAPAPTLTYIYTHPKLLVICNLFTAPCFPSTWGIKIQDKKRPTIGLWSVIKLRYIKNKSEALGYKIWWGQGELLLLFIPIHHLTSSRQEAEATLGGVVPWVFLPPPWCSSKEKDIPYHHIPSGECRGILSDRNRKENFTRDDQPLCFLSEEGIRNRHHVCTTDLRRFPSAKPFPSPLSRNFSWASVVDTSY